MSLVGLLGVSAWRIMDIVELQREDKARAEEAASSQDVKPKLDPYHPIGVIGFVSNQFASETLIVPVNPFHPAYEEMAGHVTVINGTNVVIVTTRDGKRFVVPANINGQGPNVLRPGGNAAGNGQNGGNRYPGGMPPGGIRQQGGRGKGGLNGFVPPKKHIPYIAFSGFMERPDGTLAPYVKSTEGGGKFLVKGDFYKGAVVTSAGKDGVEFEFSNGKKIKVVPGGEPQAFTPEAEEHE